MSQFSFFILMVLGPLGLATLAVCDRPIYNIAHMVNPFLGLGANALEADVTFAKDGTPEYLYHGIPCDFVRDCLHWAYIGNYVNALRDRTKPTSPKFNRNFVLIMFDLKLKKLEKSVLSSAGVKFADSVLIPFYRNNSTKVKVMLSVPNLSLGDFISGVLGQLENGWELSRLKKRLRHKRGKESHEKERALRKLGVAPGHAWLSSGITNWSPRLFLKELKAQVIISSKSSTKYFFHNPKTRL